MNNIFQLNSSAAFGFLGIIFKTYEHILVTTYALYINCKTQYPYVFGFRTGELFYFQKEGESMQSSFMTQNLSKF